MKIPGLLASLVLVATAGAAQETKKVETQLGRYEKETYYVLRSKPSVKHGPFTRMRGAQPSLTGFYKLGLPDSTWTEYNRDGTRAAKGTFSRGQKVGAWDYYSRGDTLIQTYDYTSQQLRYALVTPKERATLYTVVSGSETKQSLLDRPAMYVGGQAAMHAAMGSQMRYPVQAMRKRTQGEVRIEFIVDAQGHASGHRIKSGISPECDQEALRVVKLIPDAWLPALLQQQPVATVVEVPINFRMM
ncbi:TonB family protein [Hymenobacter tenuis]